MFSSPNTLNRQDEDTVCVSATLMQLTQQRRVPPITLQGSFKTSDAAPTFALLSPRLTPYEIRHFVAKLLCSVHNSKEMCMQ